MREDVKPHDKTLTNRCRYQTQLHSDHLTSILVRTARETESIGNEQMLPDVLKITRNNL